MRLAAILPTANLWGGVKRFLELGNRFVALGHHFAIFTPEGHAPAWFSFAGETKPFSALGVDEYDAVFCTEPLFVPQLIASRSRVRIFYHVLRTEDLRPVIKHPDISIFVNSTNLFDFDSRRYHIQPFLAVGGVDASRFRPVHRALTNETVILTYGRLSMKRKGTRFVVKACERLYRKGYNIKLLLFDTPLNAKDRSVAKAFRADVPFEFILDYPVEQTNEIFCKADIFASAEKNAGWANTVAEAMACGLPVVATASGSKDILINNTTGLTVWRNAWSVQRGLERLVRDPSLRVSLGANGRALIEKYDWDILAGQILGFVQNRLGAGLSFHPEPI